MTKIYVLCKELGRISEIKRSLNPKYHEGEFLRVYDTETQTYSVIDTLESQLEED